MCHEAGVAYAITQGAFDNVPVVTPSQRDCLVNLVEVFNEYLDPACTPRNRSTARRRPAG